MSSNSNDYAAKILRTYEASAIAQAYDDIASGDARVEPDFVRIHGSGAFARLALDLWTRAYGRIVDEASVAAGTWETERAAAIADLAAREAGQ